jgi:hypothetical protein
MLSLQLNRFKNISCVYHNTIYKIMACTSCSTSDGKGQRVGDFMERDSCNKLTVFDWLSNMSLPTGQLL